MTEHVLIVRTTQLEEHHSVLDGVHDLDAAQEVLNAVTEGTVEWVMFCTGERLVALPVEVITYIAVAPVVDAVQVSDG